MKQTSTPLFAVYMPESIDKPLLETLHSGYIGQGSKVEEFERALAEFVGSTNVLTLNTGTSALHLAYRLAGVEPGTEVITTPMTCTATNLPILANGGTIVWADVDSQTGLIDPVDVERKITPRTKAIVGVDWGGTPCDWDALMAIGHKYGVKVIEDAAHAFGATYKGRKVGTLADFTTFSFQAIKHISTVDGGLLVCRDSVDYKRGKLLRWYGIDRETERRDSRIEEDILEWGYKFHMNDVSATIGLTVLPDAPAIVDKHRANAVYYDDHLDAMFKPAWRTSYEHESAHWLYTVKLPSRADRDAFMGWMRNFGIMTSQVHARNDTHTTFAPFKANLPGLESFSGRQVSIPVHWKVGKEERERIVAVANRFATSPL